LIFSTFCTATSPPATAGPGVLLFLPQLNMMRQAKPIWCLFLVSLLGWGLTTDGLLASSFYNNGYNFLGSYTERSLLILYLISHPHPVKAVTGLPQDVMLASDVKDVCSLLMIYIVPTMSPTQGFFLGRNFRKFGGNR
jgi:hypothetical protein